MTITRAEVALRGRDETAAAFRSVIRNAETAQKQITTKLRGAFAFLGGGTALLGMGRMVTASIRAGDELAKFSQKSGLGARAASELAHAARMADLDISSLSTGVKFLQKNLSEAADGSKSAQASFRSIGLEWQDLRRIAPDRQLEAIADRLAAIGDPADRTRAAIDLLGRSGQDLLPLFSQGAEGIRKAREEARQLGKSFSESDLQNFQKADEALKRLRASWSALGDIAALRVSPTLSDIADKLRIGIGGATRLEALRNEVALLEQYQLSAKAAMEAATPPPYLLQQQQRLIQARKELIALERQARLEAVSRGPGLSGSVEIIDFKGMEEARLQLQALADPVGKLTAQFETQKAKITELAEKYPELAGVAGQAIAQITKDYQASVIEAEYALMKLRIADEQTREALGRSRGILPSASELRQGLKEVESVLERGGKELEGVEIFHESDAQNTAAINRNLEEVRKRTFDLGDRTIRLEGDFFKVNESAKSLMETLKDEGARRAFGFISDAIYNMGSGMKAFAKSAIDAFRRILADYATQKLFELFQSMGSKSGGGGGGILGSIFGSGFKMPFRTPSTVPGFASGGFMPPGSFGMVGERGPELAMAGPRGATIIPFPKDRMGAAPVVNVSVVTNVDARGASVELINRLPGILEQNRKAAVDEAEVRFVEGLRRNRYRLG